MMVDWPATIIGEIRDRHATRAQIAHTYSLCLHRIDFPWGRVNAEILARYRPSGLDWIKREAWRRLKERVRETEATRSQHLLTPSGGGEPRTD